MVASGEGAAADGTVAEQHVGAGMAAGTKRTAGAKPAGPEVMAGAKVAAKTSPRKPIQKTAAKAAKPKAVDAAAAPARVLISSLRNEGPFLLEWVAYHRAIGFDRIVIAHNDCTDGSAELLAALDAIGWVTALENPVPEGTAPQQAAAQALAASGCIAPGDWVIWLDLDEFLNIHTGDGTVTALTEAIGEAKALLVPWRLFGDSHGAEFRGRFLDPAFRFAAGRDRVENWALKTLFRYGPAIARLDIHRPWLVEGSGWTREEVLTAAGKPMDRRHGPNLRWLSGVNPRSFPRMGLHDAGWDLAQINHYALRSKALYALKRLRGRGYWVEAQSKTKLRHSANFYSSMNLNDAEDVTILRWQDRVSLLMAEAAADAGVSEVLALVARRLEQNMAQIEDVTPPAEGGPASAPDAAVQPAPAEAAYVPVMWFPEEVKAFVQERYRAATCILEYGTGGSTVFAAGETSAQILSIESDRDWAAKISAYLAQEGLDRPGVEIRWADIGPTGAWGKPTKSREWGKFHTYPMQPWRDASFDPDLVMIDGRFRLGCLVAAALHCRHPLTVLIDDYEGRPAYHRAEAIFPRTRMIGHMAQFDLVPRAFTNAEFAQMLPWFFTAE